MNATTSDTNGIASYTWSKQSGTGAITFGTGSAEDTTISADAEEAYVLRLTVVDNAGNSAYDELTFTWDTTGPSVNVGSNLIVNQQYSMNATVSDSSGVASYTWSKQSGTGTVTFGTGSAEDTTISANAEELYVLRLTVVDNAGNSAHDELNFTWDTTAPSVNVGGDVSVNAIHAMNATSSDANGIATYSWSKQSGAGTITFSAGTSEDTNISADTGAIYVLRLTVTDNAGNTANDELNFTWVTELPTVSIVTPSDNSYCNATNCDSVTVSGLCSEEGRNVVIGGDVADTATCTSGEWSVDIDYSGEAEGALSITADHDDAIGSDAIQALSLIHI